MRAEADLGRPDLLAFLEAYAGSDRRCGRVDTWRARELRRRDIAAVATAIAQQLRRHGMAPGDRVGLRVADGPLWIAACFGALAAESVAVPVDVTYDAELCHRLTARLGLRGWVIDGERQPLDAGVPEIVVDWQPPAASFAELQLPEPDPRAPALVVLTSGTTGDPQEVELRHSHLRAVLDPLAREIERYRLALRLSPRLHIAVTLPASHLYGQLMGVYLPVVLDADVDFVTHMAAADLARRLRYRGALVLAAVPNTLDRLAGYLREEGRRRWGEQAFEARSEAAAGRRWPYRWARFAPLRRRLGWRLIAVLSAGARLDPDVERLWRRLGYLVVQGYGLTEAAPLVTLTHPLRPKSGSLGRPLPGVEVRLADDGEILVRGANVAAGGGRSSWIDSERWLHTGDIGRREADGSLRFVGRRDDRIVTPGGVNLDPDDLESELRRQPGISDAVVMEEPSGPPGRLCAVLQAPPGVDVDAAVRRVNQSVPEAARLRSWHVWPRGDLPRTPTGKPRRQPLRAWLAEAAGQSRRAKGVGDDATGRLVELVAEVCEKDAAALRPDATLGDVLDSLQRVELAVRLEEAYGIFLDERALHPDRRLADLAADLEAGARPGATVLRGAEPGGGAAGDQESPREPAAAPAPRPAEPPRRRAAGWQSQQLPSSGWRHAAPVRGVRFLLREALVVPALRCFVRLDARGLQNLDRVRPPFLLVANHSSLLDPLAILGVLPPPLRSRVAPAARWEHFVEHDWGRAHWVLGVLALDLVPLVQHGDWRPTLATAGLLADRGRCPLVFPEGRRSPDGLPKRFLPGAALMARELRLPLVACAHAGLHRVLPPQRRWPNRPPLSRHLVAVHFGTTLAPPRPGDDLEALTRKMEEEVRALHATALRAAGSA